MKKLIFVLLLCIMSACGQSNSSSSISYDDSSDFNTDSSNSGQTSSILTSDSIGSSSSINSSDSSNQDTKYLITFDKQDGTGGSDSVEVSIDDPMPVADKPTKDEHNFLGYFDSATSGVQYYTATMTSARNWDKSSGATLYAHWEKMSYTVTLDKQGGTGGSDNVTVNYGSAMPAATKPTKDEHNFLGYFDLATSGVQYYTATMTSARNWDKSSGATLYAHWEKMSYTVTLDKQGGMGGSDSVSVNYGSAMPAATAPSREDNTFLGYYDAKTGGIQYYDANMNSVKNWDKNSGGILYAQWTDKYLKGLEFYFNETIFAYNVSIGTLTNEKEIIIPSTYKGLPIQQLTQAGFKNCTNLEKITLPSTIISINYEAFMNCEKLTSVNIPKNVEIVGQNAFFNTKIWNDAPENSIVYVGKWVIGYKGNISGISLKNDIVGIGVSAFSNCQSITSMIVPDSVIYINYQAFYNCQELISILLSENLAALFNQTFYNCGKLADIDIPDSVTMIHWPFEGTKIWNDSPTNDVVYVDNWVAGYKGVLTNVVFREGTIGITNGAFSNISLSTIQIPTSMKYIDHMLFFTSDVISIDVTSNNPYFSSVDGSLYDKDKTTLIYYANGKTASTFIIPSSVKKISMYAFSNNNYLTSINIPAGITEIGTGVFYYSKNLQSVTFAPSSQLEVIGNAAFAGTNLSEIKIPASVKTIEGQAFSGCGNLVSVTFESGSLLEKIGYYAFSSCANLIGLSLPSSVWFIGQNAFSGTKKIASITISNNVTYIGYAAFNGWTNSQKIYIKGYLQAPSSWDANWNQGSSAIIYWGQ